MTARKDGRNGGSCCPLPETEGMKIRMPVKIASLNEREKSSERYSDRATFCSALRLSMTAPAVAQERDYSDRVLVSFDDQFIIRQPLQAAVWTCTRFPSQRVVASCSVFHNPSSDAVQNFAMPTNSGSRSSRSLGARIPPFR